MRSHLTPIRMATSKEKNKTKNVSKDRGKLKPLCTVGRNVKWCSPYGKQYRDSAEKLKIELSYDLAIPLLSRYSKESKVGSQKDICMPLFTAAVFTIPKCLLMGEWINIMWYKNIYWRRQWHPTPVLLPGKSHGRRSLVGCRPWGFEESDTTEPLDFHFSLSCLGEGNGNPPVFLPGESQGRGSLVGRTELDTTEVT